MKKRTLSLFLALVMSLSLMIVPSVAFYVPEANWIQTDVQYTGTTTCTDRGAEQTVYLYPALTQLIYPFSAEIYDLNTGSVVDPFTTGQAGTFYVPITGHIYRFAYETGDTTQYYYVQADDAGTPATPAEQPSSWAADAVQQGSELGIVPDSLQSQYGQATTRAEFCALATGLYETVTGSEITDRATFTDTTDENVEKMAALGVVNGTGGGKFEPNAQLTREEAATMLSRLAGALDKPLTEQAPTFADNDSISSWAAAAVGQMQATGVMNGVGENTFAPADDYTREQSIVTIMRLYDIVK